MLVCEQCAAAYDYLRTHWLLYVRLMWRLLLCFPLQRSCPSAYPCPTARSRRMWWAGGFFLQPDSVAQFPSMLVLMWHITIMAVVTIWNSVRLPLCQNLRCKPAQNGEVADLFFLYFDSGTFDGVPLLHREKVKYLAILHQKKCWSVTIIWGWWWCNGYRSGWESSGTMWFDYDSWGQHLIQYRDYEHFCSSFQT